MKTDRIFGVVVILGALAYIASAYNLPPGSLFDKLGPKAFPIVIGCGLLLFASAMILRPDDNPVWPEPRTALSIAFAAVVLLVYAYALKPLGFLLPTAVAASILSFQITPKPVASVLTGVGLSVGLFVIFRYVLGLSLFAVPRGFFG
ncbi:tripartite tricarboxylate transporter TctB family protein [Marivivens marinus]|uniref:tripartite tricarboxylate transporter TctB family protein n=1 Tax=Marivivens marinus TaxID=3110173 RepID=UPI003B8458E5